MIVKAFYYRITSTEFVYLLLVLGKRGTEWSTKTGFYQGFYFEPLRDDNKANHSVFQEMTFVLLSAHQTNMTIVTFIWCGCKNSGKMCP